MSDKTLEFTVEINADETILHILHNTLSASPPLANKLANVIRQTLSSTLLTNNLEVKVQNDHLIDHALDEPILYP